MPSVIKHTSGFASLGKNANADLRLQTIRRAKAEAVRYQGNGKIRKRKVPRTPSLPKLKFMED